MKELIYELPEEELKVKTNNAVMDAKESLKKFWLVRDLNTTNDEKLNSSVYNNQTTISLDKN